MEQLRTHTRRLNTLHPPESHNGRTMVQLYEKGYGKDAAGIAMEAILYGKAYPPRSTDYISGPHPIMLVLEMSFFFSCLCSPLLRVLQNINHSDPALFLLPRTHRFTHLSSLPARNQGFDVVLVDTAGRMQDNAPLMTALAKLIAVNTPDLVLFVGEALVGNEAVDQLVSVSSSVEDGLSHRSLVHITVSKLTIISKP